MATVKAHKSLDTFSLPELASIYDGTNFAPNSFTESATPTPDLVEFFPPANGLDLVFHGALSDLVVLVDFPFTMTVTSIEVTKNGSVLYEISGTSFQIDDFYNDALDLILDATPAEILKDDDTIRGSKQRDNLLGFDGADLIKGGKGSDIVDGGAGKNTLVGGRGGDFFFFTVLEKSDRADRVSDFKHGGDQLALVGAPFDVLEFEGGVLRAGMFHLGNKAEDGNDYVIYNRQAGALFFDGDGNGSDAKVKIAVLDDPPVLSHDDIFDGLIAA